jgi:hypothetical protein
LTVERPPRVREIPRSEIAANPLWMVLSPVPRRRWNAPCAVETNMKACAEAGSSLLRIITRAFVHGCDPLMPVTRATITPSPVSERDRKSNASAEPQMSAPLPVTVKMPPYLVEPASATAPTSISCVSLESSVDN